MEDELIWAKNEVGGVCIVKMGYLAKLPLVDIQDYWWLEKLWKVNAPHKTHIFCASINEEGLTWEILKKRGQEGYKLCPLCRSNEDLLFKCLFFVIIHSKFRGR